MVFEEDVLIPRDRVAVLIGEKGTVKRRIEKLGNVKLKIVDNTIHISAEDALDMMIAKNVVEAIGRGFNPAVAQKLFKEDYAFEQLELNEFTKSKKSTVRLKGRVIGLEGKARRIIESQTGTNISVYGKTVCIIGKLADTQKARDAVERLLGGAEHASVFRMLEKHGR